MHPEAIAYIKDRYLEEVARFSYVEEKSSKMLGLLSVVIAAFGAMIGFKNEEILSPCSLLDWFVCCVCLLSIIALVSSWGQALRCLKLGQCPVPSKSRENAEYLASNQENEVLEQIFDCYVNTTEQLTPVIEEKAAILELSYRDLVFSAWCVGVFSILLIGKELLL